MKVEKPWGHEIRWAANDKYIGKILHIKDGHRLSKQYHREKDETIYVLEGSLLLEFGPHIDAYVDDKTPEVVRTTLVTGTSQRIEPNIIHRFCAEMGDVTLVEVSTPEMADVVRLSDDYDRETTENWENESELYTNYGGD